MLAGWRRIAQGLMMMLVAGSITRAALAQESINYASISGTVTDPQGAVVAGATITARHLDTNVVSRTRSDASGRFRFPFLRVGPYELIVSATGFADATQRLTLSVGAAFDLPIALAVAGVTADVRVTADAPVVEAARTQIAGTVGTDEITRLPLNGRNFLDIALLVPGVSLTNVGGGTQIFPETSAVPGVGLSVSSQRNLSNNFIVDGLSANDDAAALSGISFGVEAIGEMQVVTSGGQAELGRALGGYVNIVTRSGTNVRQGEVYSYMRDDALNAKNPLIGSTLPMSQEQFGGSLGGPLVRNRTFLFINAERRLLDQSGLVTISDANVAAINARLDAVGFQGPRIATGVYANPIHTTHLTAKVDHHVNGADHVSVRYSLYDVWSTNSRGAGALNAATASAGIDNRDQTLAVSDVRSFSSRTVNETRAQVAWSDLAAPPVDEVGPSVSISGVASFGRLSGSPTARRNTMVQVVDSVSHQAGAHALRAGVDVLYNDLAITYPRSVKGSYAFSSLANFLSGTYNNAGFTQTFGASEVAQTNPNLGIYVQDEWKAGARITLNLGVRYDLQWLQTIATDTNNVSPRFGLAWLPLAGRSTVVRFNAGRFYDRVPLRALANALLSAGNTTDVTALRQIGVSLSPAQAGAPVFPSILGDAPPATTLPNLTTMDRHLQNAYSNQASIEVEQRIGASTTVSVAYQHLRGRNLIMSINQNVPTCVAAGSNNGCRPNPAYANNSQYTAAGTSVYDGLLLSLVQRASRWGTYRVSYAYSQSENNIGEAFFSGPIDPFDLSKDWARSDDDQRHRLNLSGTLATPSGPAQSWLQRLTRDIRVSGALQFTSALPLNITSGVTTVQGTAGRPIVDGVFIPRNAGTLEPFASLSLRVARTIPLPRGRALEILADIFNLTNRTNVLAKNASFGSGAYPASPSSTFGQVTAVGEPRAVQVGVRVRF